jgi:hypothetical protein
MGNAGIEINAIPFCQKVFFVSIEKVNLAFQYIKQLLPLMIKPVPIPTF